MRWRILKPLLQKEALRHLANRGGLALAALLIAAAFLLALGKNEPRSDKAVNGVLRCFVLYEQGDPKQRQWANHLSRNVPGDLPIAFQPAHIYMRDGAPALPRGSAAIVIRSNGQNAYKVQFYREGKFAQALSPFGDWFWRESLAFFQRSNVVAEMAVPTLEQEHLRLAGGSSAADAARLDDLSGAATALVLFGLCLFCIYLMPSLTCEERERGVLLAQVLSPASPGEILAAKFIFYPLMGGGLAAILAGIYEPAALLRPFFWLVLLACAVGYLGVGLTIASIARTQRAASMGALCYMLAIALLLTLTQRFPGIPPINWLTLEYHCTRMAHAALEGEVVRLHWLQLGVTAALAAAWGTLAMVLFRRRGWQ